VLVQSQPDDRDTDWLLDLWPRTSRWCWAWSGWADLRRPTPRSGSPPWRAKRQASRPAADAADLDDDAWIAAPGLDPAFDAMVAHGLSLDALVLTRHLPHLLALARRRPTWRSSSTTAPSRRSPPANEERLGAGIAALAAQPQVFCKLSGLLTEAAPGQDPQALAPYVARLVAAFGPERLMWGSDWPVLNLAGDYGGWLALAGTSAA
jgi:L-fuconolactonase